MVKCHIYTFTFARHPPRFEVHRETPSGFGCCWLWLLLLLLLSFFFSSNFWLRVVFGFGLFSASGCVFGFGLWALLFSAGCVWLLGFGSFCFRRVVFGFRLWTRDPRGRCYHVARGISGIFVFRGLEPLESNPRLSVG